MLLMVAFESRREQAHEAPRRIIGRASFQRCQDASSAAETMSSPPTASGMLACAAPSATADALANSTSVTMTTAVALALRRAAPYCSARLLPRKSSPSANAGSIHDQAGGGGA